MYRVITILTLTVFFTACQESQVEKEPSKEPKVQTEQRLFSNNYYKCEKERGETHIGISSCMEEELKEQDRALNIAYKEAKTSIQPFRVNTLKEVQRKWIAYRDSKCAFFHHKESGQVGSIEEESCLIKETITRTKELKEIF